MMALSVGTAGVCPIEVLASVVTGVGALTVQPLGLEPMVNYGTTEYRAPGGEGNINGRTLRDIAGDLRDGVMYCMGGSGQWFYSCRSDGHPDQSTNGWAPESMRPSAVSSTSIPTIGPVTDSVVSSMAVVATTIMGTIASSVVPITPSGAIQVVLVNSLVTPWCPMDGPSTRTSRTTEAIPHGECENTGGPRPASTQLVGVCTTCTRPPRACAPSYRRLIDSKTDETGPPLRSLPRHPHARR